MNNITQLLESISRNEFTLEEVLENITEQDLNLILNSNFKNTQNNLLLAKGDPINPGDVSGYLITNRQLANRLFEEANKRKTTINIIYSPAKSDITDFSNIRQSVGFFTELKGRTTFCSLQASSEGKPTIGNVSFKRDMSRKTLVNTYKFLDGSTIEVKSQTSSIIFNNNHIVKEGDIISISGQHGKIYKGYIKNDISKISKVYSILSLILIEFQTGSSYNSITDTPTYIYNQNFLLDTVNSDMFKGFQKLLKYCYSKTTLKIYSTSHTPETLAYSGLIASDIYCKNNEIIISQRKEDFGLGLLRDERIWDSLDEIDLLRLVFLGEEICKERYQTIKMQYVNTLSNKLFNVIKMGTGSIAVIRLLCMPLTMLFNKNFNIKQFCDKYFLDIEHVQSKIVSLSGEKEVYHGFRGVRVTVHRRDIAELWCESVIKASLRAYNQGKLDKLQILLSMVTLPQEISGFIKVLNNTIAKFDASHIFSGVSIMIETAGSYILIEDFMKIHEDNINLNGLLFGGNDFTAACLNMNRSDSASTIIPTYIQEGLFKSSPFKSLNTQLVGKAIIDILEKVNNTENHLLGLGGEIAGDWNTVQWLVQNCTHKGLNYISTPPNRMIYSLIASAKATCNKGINKSVIT